MSYNKNELAYQRFIKFAKKYYWELSAEERRFLTYSGFVNMLAEEYFDDYTEDTKRNCTKKVYKYFNDYVKGHPKYKALDTKVYIKLKNVTDLFEIDSKRDTIKEALGIRYSYCSWVLNADGEDRRKNVFFVMIECGKDVAETIYNTVGECFDDLITNLFFSYKGILVTFDNQSKKDKFIECIKK